MGTREKIQKKMGGPSGPPPIPYYTRMDPLRLSHPQEL